MDGPAKKAPAYNLNNPAVKRLLKVHLPSTSTFAMCCASWLAYYTSCYSAHAVASLGPPSRPAVRSSLRCVALLSYARSSQEYRELQKEGSDQFTAAPLEEDIFEFHFTIRGPSGTDFEGACLFHRSTYRDSKRCLFVERTVREDPVLALSVTLFCDVFRLVQCAL